MAMAAAILPPWRYGAPRRLPFGARAYNGPALVCETRHSIFRVAASTSSASAERSFSQYKWLRGIYGGRVACSATAAIESASSQDAAALLSWLHANGAVTDGVQIAADSRGGLGLVAAADCVAGQRLLQLPSHLQLTAARGSRGNETTFPALRSIMETIPEPLWALELGLVLLSERARDGSFWWPYIRCLPQRFSVPVFFSPVAIGELRYPPLVEQVKMRSRFLLHLSQEVMPLALREVSPQQHPFCGQHVDTGALAWAMAAVSSRAFRPRGLKQPAALLPLVDMANHSSEPNAALRACDPSDGGAVEMVAVSDMKAGSPVELSYGPLSNDFLLLDYGFVEEACRHDRVELRFQLTLLEAAREIAGVQQQADSSEALQALLTHLHLEGQGSNLLVTLGGNEHVDGRLLAVARGMYADWKKADLQSLQDWRDSAPLGRDVEEKALRTLIGLCLLMEAQLPPPTDVPATITLPSDVQLAVAFRSEKRRIVINALRFLKERMQLLKQQ